MPVIPTELTPGFWQWTSITHQIDEPDPRRTSRHHAFFAGDALVLVDPVHFSASTPELDALYARAPAGGLHVVMTDPASTWHTGERICARHAGTIWGAAATKRVLEDPSRLCVLEPGQPGPGGVVALEVGAPSWRERAIWVPSHGTVVFGTIISSDPASGALTIPGAAAQDARVRDWTRAQVAPTFAPLLDLPVRRIALRHAAVIDHGVAGALAAMLEV